jgi:phosphatidylserine decarboxylase
MITKYGYVTLGIIAVICFLVLAVGFLLNNIYLKYLFIFLPLIFLAFSINFFRDPDRKSPQGDNIVLSPADGKVLFVKEVLENRFIKGKSKQVSIFMSPLNVHVNRIPISGKVDYLKYHEGKFIAAFEDKASDENERSEFGISSKYGKIFFTQVAGFVARRIVYELKQGDEVTAGERFGMIKFGSRVDVIVPFDWNEKIKKDDVVTAGETILFEYPVK